MTHPSPSHPAHPSSPGAGAHAVARSVQEEASGQEHGLHPLHTPPPVVQDRHRARLQAPLQPMAVWSSPLQRAAKLQVMLGQLAARGVGNQAGLTTLAPHGLDMQSLDEWLGIQQAVVQRLQQQQREWFEGLQAIAHEYSELQAANTLSKFIGQEYNVAAQLGALVNRQLSSWVGLVENVQVDCAYWVSRKHAGHAEGMGSSIAPSASPSPS